MRSMRSRGCWTSRSGAGEEHSRATGPAIGEGLGTILPHRHRDASALKNREATVSSVASGVGSDANCAKKGVTLATPARPAVLRGNLTARAGGKCPLSPLPTRREVCDCAASLNRLVTLWRDPDLYCPRGRPF